MGIRFRSCNVYGLGYCPTISWSAIIIVTYVCDICTSFATRLRFDLYTFWEIFGWVWLWRLCVQKFWACKFMVSFCLLWSVRWGVTGDRVGVIECDESVEWEADGADVCVDVRGWPQYCRVRCWLGWRPNCCVSCGVCRRVDDCSGLPYCIPRNCAVFAYDCVQW